MVLYQGKRLYLAVIILGIVIGAYGVINLYIFNWSVIIESFSEHDGALGVVLIIGLRIIIVLGMAMYTFLKWLKQEQQYFSDLPFLFGSFFLLLAFGKSLDLFIDFIFFKLSEALVLIILKIRFFVLILNLFPMIYLSNEMILYSFSLKPRFKKLHNENIRNKISFRLILIILMSETIAGVLAPNSRILSFYYPIIAIPSLITIIWLFYFACKHKRLLQVNSLILTTGFGLYLLSQIIRPLLQYIISESSLFVIFIETIDLLIFVIIFTGFYKTPRY